MPWTLDGIPVTDLGCFRHVQVRCDHLAAWVQAQATAAGCPLPDLWLTPVFCEDDERWELLARSECLTPDPTAAAALRRWTGLDPDRDDLERTLVPSLLQRAWDTAHWPTCIECYHARPDEPPTLVWAVAWPRPAS